MNIRDGRDRVRVDPVLIVKYHCKPTEVYRELLRFITMMTSTGTMHLQLLQNRLLIVARQPPPATSLTTTVLLLLTQQRQLMLPPALLLTLSLLLQLIPRRLVTNMPLAGWRRQNEVLRFRSGNRHTRIVGHPTDGL